LGKNITLEKNEGNKFVGENENLEQILGKHALGKENYWEKRPLGKTLRNYRSRH